MKAVGFSFVRNAVKYDYPVIEAVRSVLPLCDEFVMAVGDSEDDSLGLVRQIAPEKVRIIETVWDDSLREGGRVLAVETDKAKDAVPEDADWLIYIQGDEVIHEKYLDEIYAAMEKWKDRPEVDGFLFKYLHFYGSFSYTGLSPRWYPYEIRVVRNDPQIRSYRDAQGFRKKDGSKLNVKQLDAYVYHYGWVREPDAMQRKYRDSQKLWHSDDWIEQNVVPADSFDYSEIDALLPFDGTHPKVMEERIRQKNWSFEHDMSFNRLSFKDRAKIFLDQKAGIRLGYKNYKVV